MKYVPLGSSNLLVSEFCLGTMMFGGKTSPAEAIEITHRAIDAGVSFIDTADVYNGGRSEEIVGEALKGRRDAVVLASKAGMGMGAGPNDRGISRYHLVRAAEASLKRLVTERIDIFYVHWPMERMNLEEMLRGIDDLVSQGKVLYAACSNFPAWLLCRTQWQADVSGYAPIVVGQYPYNLIERGLEVELLPAAKALGIGIVTYRPLSGGTLTAKYLGGVPNDARGSSDERFTDWTSRYGDAITKLKAFAEERGHTAADAAIAWVRSHPVVTAPIVGISRIGQLEANLSGFEWEMSQEEREEISGFFPTAVWEESGGSFPVWRRSYDIMG